MNAEPTKPILEFEPGNHRLHRLWLMGAVVLLAAGCAGNPPSASTTGARDSAAGPASAASDNAYRLGAGDRLRVIVFGEEDLSGEFEVDDTGAVSLPLVGQVQAEGETLRTFEERGSGAAPGGLPEGPPRQHPGHQLPAVLHYRRGERAGRVPLRERYECPQRRGFSGWIYPQSGHFEGPHHPRWKRSAIPRRGRYPA